MTAISKRVFLSNATDLNYPEITLSLDTLMFPNVAESTYSAAQSFTVSAIKMLANLVITAPTDFIINTDGSNTDMSPISLPPTAGNIAATTIYVKFHPTENNPYDDNIVFNSTNLLERKINVIGTVAP